MKFDTKMQRASGPDFESEFLRRSQSSRRHVEQIRLQTLTRLRWLAVIGQTAAVLVIGLSAWLNVFLGLRNRSIQRIGYNQASWLLAYDILQLAVLFYLTGGLENPFAFLFLVPVAVSASALPVERTILLGLLALFQLKPVY